MKELILKHALLNAVEHDGRANVQAVLGKVIAEDPSLKKEIKKVIPEIKKIVKEVNAMNVDEQEKSLEKFSIKKEKKVERYGLPELPGAKMGKVVTAFPPEPSKYPHLGHAKAAVLNFEFAKKYGGKFILRFEDSNPELAKKEYYSAIVDGLKWLGLSWDKIDYLSEFVPKYYKTIEILIRKGHAYVCLCSQPTIKAKRAAGEACSHRENDVNKNLQLWEKMLKKFGEGEATVRMKINMIHPNTTMRDPSLVRIVKKAHPRTKRKYRVWPVYDFATAMLDVWEKVTHRVRSKEFELRKELQQHIQKVLGEKSPHIIEIGRLNIRGVPTQGRVIREAIARKQFMGWDDPRLTTLIALRRRGFVPEAIREFLISTGVTKAESVLEWSALEAFNRKFVDKIADRYFAVLNPVKISVDKKIKSAVVPYHPEKNKKREIKVNPSAIYIEKTDYESFRKGNAELMYVGEVHDETQKIHWVSEPNVKIKIVMPSGGINSAIAEPAVKKLKVGQTIQLYRIGFCRVDKTGKEIVLYFTHK